MISAKNLLVCTAAFYKDKAPLRILEDSAARFGVPVEFLGLGRDHESSFDTKVIQFAECLREKRSAGYEYCLYVDAADTFFQSGVDAIVRNYRDFAPSILYSAECYCWPDRSLERAYPAPPVRTATPFLCAGCFIGPIDTLLRLFSRAVELRGDALARHGRAGDLPGYAHSSDQYWMTRVFLQEREAFDMRLDYRSELFYSMDGAFGGIKFDWERKQAVARQFGTEPCVLHFNGTLPKDLMPHFYDGMAKAGLPGLLRRIAIDLVSMLACRWWDESNGPVMKRIKRLVRSSLARRPA